MKDALIDKYGAPSYVRDAGFDVRMTWAFDLSGAQLSGKDVERRCIRFDVLDPQNTANILFEDRKSEGCGLTIQATMGRNQVQMNAGELARYLSIYMIDGSKFPDMRSATQAYVENEVREAAKKAPTPKL
jgi:predicted 2-oxoglutarate/Fe(II)-dependent dioxygenase YbiX